MDPHAHRPTAVVPTAVAPTAHRADPPPRHGYALVEQAIRYLQQHHAAQPSLDTLAGALGCEPAALQRQFSALAGVSPKRFIQYLTKEHARQLLAQSTDVLSTTLATGLSSPGRLHDLMVTTEAMTPGEIGRQGAGVSLGIAFADSPFGRVLAAATPRGLAFLGFVDPAEEGAGIEVGNEVGSEVARQVRSEAGRAVGSAVGRESGREGINAAGGDEAALADLRQRWPRAQLRADPAVAALAAQVFTRIGPGADSACAQRPLHLLLAGTNFQIKVWEALLRVPEGRLVSYTALARAVGRPDAVRAVAGAVGRNPLSVLIPCHRVIRESGDLGGYHWGLPRKIALIGCESARRDAASPAPEPGPLGSAAGLSVGA